MSIFVPPAHTVPRYARDDTPVSTLLLPLPLPLLLRARAWGGCLLPLPRRRPRRLPSPPLPVPPGTLRRQAPPRLLVRVQPGRDAKSRAGLLQHRADPLRT